MQFTQLNLQAVNTSGNVAITTGTTTAPPTASSPATFTTLDVTPPTISALTAAGGVNSTAAITWTTNR